MTNGHTLTSPVRKFTRTNLMEIVTKEVDKASIPVPLGQNPWNPWNARHNTNLVDPRGSSRKSCQIISSSLISVE